jgi:hypothetical protein
LQIAEEWLPEEKGQHDPREKKRHLHKASSQEQVVSHGTKDKDFPVARSRRAAIQLSARAESNPCHQVASLREEKRYLYKAFKQEQVVTSGRCRRADAPVGRKY